MKNNIILFFSLDAYLLFIQFKPIACLPFLLSSPSCLGEGKLPYFLRRVEKTIKFLSWLDCKGAWVCILLLMVFD